MGGPDRTHHGRGFPGFHRSGGALRRPSLTPIPRADRSRQGPRRSPSSFAWRLKDSPGRSLRSASVFLGGRGAMSLSGSAGVVRKISRYERVGCAFDGPSAYLKCGLFTRGRPWHRTRSTRRVGSTSWGQDLHQSTHVVIARGLKLRRVRPVVMPHDLGASPGSARRPNR